MVRMSADERRESVIRAAIAEFARGGYYGTSTEAIAKRVGVSQPYLFRLFPGKRAIFLAAARRCMEDTIRTFGEAAKGLEGEDALHSMANAYTKAIAEHPERLLMQMQMYVATAAAEQAGDRELGEAVRADWMRLWETVHLPLGADPNGTTVFMAYGMLINCLVAMGFPPEHKVWEGMYPSARLKGRLEK
ncbi:TetR/AcrR family transcriptional regulator [Streptomyces sp. NBC_00365]|uniref:TetR/AcrR family transcriptional regulator n=1 Tax=Streptomyces sp. NBC_00365 TaxID=2975726 RepID=UPI0022568285|nr:TetR/AcrR family transcriptional regulator [Streptomyces sp. NBC_00365]MCX5092169.1 TetR/AcrR family transcriptional regulator [Streptomyces sp. NBC_00365]